MARKNLGVADTTTLVERFRQAALLLDEAYEEENHAKQLKNIKAAKWAAGDLDALGPDGRRALIPLLDDPAPGVRALAAGYLVRLIPERALAVLKEIDERCITRAHMTASQLLWSYEHGEPPL